MTEDVTVSHDVCSGTPPEYFFEVREKARARWEQLEADPDLAAPWHQLFKQVQSPRHVVSELLQNADDAGATEAQIQIVDGKFVFSHNGEDFIKEEFTSLCRFGYSNKRSLHTIGFRGIGFKSTFSLGDEVRLRTPTLSVAFLRSRFSEPVWIDESHSQHTEISVVIKDEFRKREINKNLEEWLGSPASLLFFDSIRRLRIGANEVSWEPASEGPIEGSTWMVSSREPEKKYLVIRSNEEQFPENAVNEIRQERMISDDEMAFPPCRVEIVLGMEGRLFVILPTGVKTELPFACNAPFIQDPARVKIKDPETSPTNRWLLKRAGELGAEAMSSWIQLDHVTPRERCVAYSLLPNVDRKDNTIEGLSGTIAEVAFETAVENAQVLLTENDTVVRKKECIAAPRRLLEVWASDQISTLFDEDSRPLLSRHITTVDRRKLSNWDLIDDISKDRVLNVLEENHLPRPDSWRRLLSLWAYVWDDVCKTFYHGTSRKGVRIVPIQGHDVLFSAEEVVRFGEKRLLQSDEDWDFLSEYLLVVNQNWLRFLGEQRQKADEEKDDTLLQEWTAAQRVLKSLGLDAASDVSNILKSVAVQAFAKEDYPLKDCIRIAQLAAKLGATVNNDFEFVTQDGCRTAAIQTIVADTDGVLDQFVDDNWYEGHVLHDDYNSEFTACSLSEWKQWISSGKSQLLQFVPLENRETKVWHRANRSKIEEFLKSREANGEPNYHYVTNKFIIVDSDFEDHHWNHWEALAKEDTSFWSSLVLRMLQQPDVYAALAVSARVLQVSTTESRKSISNNLIAGWLLKLRDLPCLLDTRGQCRKPAELLRRTPETEALRDVELFVRAEDDNEHTRPLLIILGVCDTPTGPDRLLDRLRTFVGIDDPPIYEVEKWYHRLDQLFVKCSTEEADTIRTAFATESLVLTNECGWVKKDESFLNASEDDVPGLPLIHPSVRHLSLWQKLRVNDRPTADLAIEWLQQLPTEQKLNPDELRRVRALLPRFSVRIWEECGHWLNLDGGWADISKLSYALTMQSLVPWGHLFQPVKQRTADYRNLPANSCRETPFVELPTLASRIEDQFTENLCDLPDATQKSWLRELGRGIARIVVDDSDEQQSIYESGRRMASTRWQVATGLESIPYIDGTPAGTPRRINVLWKDDCLYVEDRPVAQLFRAITQELVRAFDRTDIADAIRACVERSPEFIGEYLEENFTLLAPALTELSDDTSDQTVDEIPDSEMPAPDSITSDEPATPEESSSDEIAELPDDRDDNTGDMTDLQDDETLEENFTLLAPALTELSDDTSDQTVDEIPDSEMPAPDSITSDEPATPEESSSDEIAELPDDRDDNTGDTTDLQDDETLEDQSEDEPGTEYPKHNAPPRKTAKPQLIQLLATEAGFTRDGNERFFHPDGGWIQRVSGNVFPWEQYSAEGELVRSFWTKECCLPREALQLDAAIWSLCEKDPDRYSLVVRDVDDTELVLSGTTLNRLRNTGQITLYPAQYRIVYTEPEVTS